MAQPPPPAAPAQCTAATGREASPASPNAGPPAADRGPYPLLAAAGLGKRFVDGGRGHWPIAGLDLAVASGSTTALWGPSGSGKSTLLNVLAGVLKPDAGWLRFRQRDGALFEVSAAPEPARVRYRRRNIGFVFQAFNLIETLTVAENVLLPLALNGLAAERDAALARLDSLGVGHCRQRFPESLSAGEQQRVAIARALAHRPALVLADEPTGNLDRANADRVADMLWQAAAGTGSALVVATHSERIAARAGRVIELSGPSPS